jgi:hypothetical protein
MGLLFFVPVMVFALVQPPLLSPAALQAEVLFWV